MSRKVLAHVSVFVLVLFALLAIPAGAQAGGVCGGVYVVEAGDTLNSLAAKCGTTASAITAANPGVVEPLKAGQTLNLPSSAASSGTASAVVSGDTYNYNTYNYYQSPAPAPAAPVTYNGGVYVVQYGDTFAVIASRYGLSVNQLWAANPQIWDINYLYAGQVLNIPTAGGQTYYAPVYSANTVTVVATASPQPLSYGYVPEGTPYSSVWLVNKSATKDIYVSLQGVTRDGINVIYEYPVGSSLKVKIPSGSYYYVAWANGEQFTGSFQLGKDSSRTVTFYNDKSKSE